MRYLIIQLLLFLSLTSYAGKTFTVDSEEGITITFEVINENEKTCMLGTSNGQRAISTSSQGVLTIPSVANGYEVISIGPSSLSRCTKLTDVIIPETVSEINKSAFFNCSSLSHLNLPNSIIEIKENAFDYCNALQSITIPNGIKNISIGVFENCHSLSSINFPPDLESLDNDAFFNCYSLTSIELPSKVIRIGKFSFSGCNKLISVSVPECMEIIDNYAFYGCNSLTTINIPNNVSLLGVSAFQNCSSLKSIELPTQLEEMPEAIFSGCSALENIVVPQKIRSINNNSFKGCSSLRTITFPEKITAIGESAFEGCSGLVSFTIPKSIKTISGNTFKGCSSISSITIPEGVTKIEEHAFDGCTSLCEILFPESLLSIGKEAFYNCSSLTSITLPRKLNEIQYGAFNYCNLCTIYSRIQEPFATDDPFWPRYDFLTLYVPHNKASLYKNQYSWNRIKNIVECERTITDTFSAFIANVNETIETKFMVTKILPNEVQVGDDISSALSNNIIDGFLEIPEKIYESTTMRYQVVGIGASAYKGSNITSIKLPETISYISVDAFGNCSNLQSINIPKSVISIENAFYGCTNLNSVDVNSCKPSEINVCANNFDEIPDDATLYVPVGSKERYSSHIVWGKFKNIEEKFGLGTRDIASRYGSRADLPIYLRNDDVIEGLQFKLTLPEGVSVAEDEEGLITSTTDRTRSMTIMGSKDPEEDNSYIFVLLSLDGNAIAGNEGAVMNVKLDIAPDVAPGDYEIKIEDVYMTTSSYETLNSAEATSDLTVKDIMLGDVNNDGIINVTDAIGVVNYILKNTPSSFVEGAADVNQDGIINITDAIGVVNMILGNGASQRMMRNNTIEPQ